MPVTGATLYEVMKRLVELDRQNQAKAPPAEAKKQGGNSVSRAVERDRPLSKKQKVPSP